MSADPISGEHPMTLAIRWAKRGVPAFPICIGWDPVKGATNKEPLNDHGHLGASSDPDEVRDMFVNLKRGPGKEQVLGVGLWPGPAGLVVLDPDVKHRDDDGNVINGIAFADSLGLGDGWPVRTASGGQHRYFRKQPGATYGNDVPKEWQYRLDVRSDDGWIVAPGTVTPWGNWTPVRDWDAIQIPTLPEKIHRLLLRSSNGHSNNGSSNGNGSSHRVGGWRTYQPGRDNPSLHPSIVKLHDLLVREHGVDPAQTVLMSRVDPDTGEIVPFLYVTRPGKSFGTSASVGFVAPDVVKVWSTSWSGLPPGRHYLDRLAQGDTAGPADEEQATANRQALLRLRGDKHARAVIADEEAAAVRRLRIRRTGREFAKVEPPPVVMDRVLAAEVNLLGGPEESGKSLLARDWALSVAAGVPWRGHAVTEARHVLWIASEGLHDFSDRFVAHPLWEDAADRMSVLDVPVNLLSEQDRAWLLTEYDDIRPGMVVLDLIYAMGLSDDTGSKDVMPMITALKQVSKHWGAATLAIGHSGHDRRQRRFRGSSAWRQQSYVEWHAADGIITCERSKIGRKSGLGGPYELDYPSLRWLTTGQATGRAAREVGIREQKIRADVINFPGDTVNARALRLAKDLDLGMTQARKVISAVVKGLDDA